ncbi:3'-5' exoribonuclease domain-containing protein [Streptomyces sp. NPDC056210]|uniref:3'-5' exoribonuclease domain-containing protein n=1 Tax=Streptomyces sp. NPDC056210 TaxID=3345746 RepID=UPI0035D6E934
MTRIHYDTEFLEDGSTIELISIGMVREDGAEYYAVSSEFDEVRVREHSWLRKNVWPHLPLDDDGWIDHDHPSVKTRAEIADEVQTFILSLPEPELWAWYAAYDHVALCQLWGRMIDLPKGIPMFTRDLKQEAMRLGNPEMPKQESGEHDALADARHNLKMHISLEGAQ